MIISTNGFKRLKISQKSIICMYAVLGRFWLTLMNIVVRTNMTVIFRDMTASKKKGLKKFAKGPMRFRRTVGVKTVKIKLKRRRPNINSTTTS